MESSSPSPGRMSKWLTPVAYLSRSPISLIGVILVTTAGVLWIFLLPTLLQGEADNPYLGIPAFMILPGVFIAGLALIPIGLSIHRARRKSAGLPPEEFHELTLNSPDVRKLMAFVGVTTLANVVIVSQWGYSAVTYMDSDSFCGTTCHTVMQPEYTAYLASPHARVGCVGCHIGSGASWFVKSKISGARQVLAVAFNTYTKPIESPVQDLRPARETCEQCHWPQRFAGDRLTVRTSYADDETNTPSPTVLLLKVGGRTWRGTVGIHGAHLDPNTEITYTSIDRQRQTISAVTYKTPDGKVTNFKSALVEPTPEQLAGAETRRMDCMDCHNRPAHTFQMPETAVDRAMAMGQISPSLPFIKREAVAALRAEYADRDAASRQIGERIDAFYKTTYPETHAANTEAIRNASQAIETIYLQNIFPEMKIGWGNYPNNLGHTDFPGCFRCHDGGMLSPEGNAIKSDCDTCHELPVVDESNPELLSILGLKPQ